MKDKKLFAVLLGGRAQGCHIELHDIVFAVGHSLEETYPQLVTKWFGLVKGLHVDASVELDIIDGYKVSLSREVPSPLRTENKLLYCVNFGGYIPGAFSELHEVNFYVGNSKKEIVKRAKTDLCVGAFQQHCDDNLVVGGRNARKDVDDIITISCVDDYFINLTPTTEPTNLKIEASYRRLDVSDIIKSIN